MNRSQQSILLTGFTIGVTMIFLLTLGSTVYAQQRDTATGIEPSEPQSIDILSHKIKEGQFSDNLIGQLQNYLDEKIRFVEVIATFYDQEGNIVGTTNGYTNPTDLSAGMKAPFDLRLDEGTTDELATYDLTVSWMPVSSSEQESKVFEYSTQQQSVSGLQTDKDEEEDEE